MITCKEIWNKAKKKNPPKFKGKEYTLIAISAAASAVVSVLLSKIDATKTKITGITIIDFLIDAIMLSILVIGIIALFFGLVRYWDTIIEFIGLFWKRKEL